MLAERLSRALSPHVPGGVSQSALVRSLLEMAYTAALRSGDPSARMVLGDDLADGNPGAIDPAIWHEVLAAVRRD